LLIGRIAERPENGPVEVRMEEEVDTAGSMIKGSTQDRPTPSR
jgi:hypothetical protein